MSKDLGTTDNAAVRMNFAADVYQKGVAIAKKEILEQLPGDLGELHKTCALHIHDLEAFGLIYNCCMPDLHTVLTSKDNSAQTDCGKIQYIFSKIKNVIAELGMVQTGGIGLHDFDSLISDVFADIDIKYNDDNKMFFNECIADFIYWINTTRTRYCREPYYLTINIGLSYEEWGRETSSAVIQAFRKLPYDYTRPNIVFKVNHEINSRPGTPNHSIFLSALQCTAERMIPTYLLTDSEPNKSSVLDQLGIMGCRTRVLKNLNGEDGCIGRGNIANVTLNLPQLAIKSGNVKNFFHMLDGLMCSAKQILVLRAELMRKAPENYLRFIFDNNLCSGGCITYVEFRSAILKM